MKTSCFSYRMECMYKDQHSSLSEELANSVRKLLSMFSILELHNPNLELHNPNLPLVQDPCRLQGYRRSNELNKPECCHSSMGKVKPQRSGVTRIWPDTWHNWKPRGIFTMCWSTVVITIWKQRMAGHHTVVCCMHTLKHKLLDCVLKSLLCRANAEAVEG